jgi:hypothetical protein
MKYVDADDPCGARRTPRSAPDTDADIKERAARLEAIVEAF